MRPDRQPERQPGPNTRMRPDRQPERQPGPNRHTDPDRQTGPNRRPRPVAAEPTQPVPVSQPAPPLERAQGRELPSRQTHNPEREAVTERIPIRTRQEPPPAARPMTDLPASGRPDATATHPGGEPSLGMLASLAGTSAGAVNDDPLTSPSFSMPTQDSRSYRGARRKTQPSVTGRPAPPDSTPAAAGYGSSTYGPPAGYGSGAYGPAGSSGDYSNGGPANGGYSNGGRANGGGVPTAVLER